MGQVRTGIDVTDQLRVLVQVGAVLATVSCFQTDVIQSVPVLRACRSDVRHMHHFKVARCRCQQGRASRMAGVIAYLSGVVREVRENSAVIVAGGVGYEVQCPAGTLGKLVVGQNAELSTRFVVREDAQLLFGFSDADSLKLFDLVTGVSGVGPKLGLSLLSAMPVSALAQGLMAGDVKLLSSVSGVGKKTAERLVLELQNKVPEHLAAAGVPAGTRATPVSSTAGRDAIEALLALGFREAQVRGVVAELLGADPTQSADALIRKGLGRLR